ncbi:hypothetical protein [Candidatus Thiodiazotropha endoloripes]|uniref:hypothetical protein n=1 Tax=Candidatus Thiodiazotropha endoloripes TaxID=1818881 RepID=UPI001112A0FF|nr:hypothetical protein [Candidatus Thiodiazotropha endoloripes]
MTNRLGINRCQAELPPPYLFHTSWYTRDPGWLSLGAIALIHTAPPLCHTDLSGGPSLPGDYHQHGFLGYVKAMISGYGE